jgi:hypothetical protein
VVFVAVVAFVDDGMKLDKAAAALSGSCDMLLCDFLYAAQEEGRTRKVSCRVVTVGMNLMWRKCFAQEENFFFETLFCPVALITSLLYDVDTGRPQIV